MSAILQAIGIGKIFKQAEKDVSILENISVCFKKSESYSIMGASGSGKSTLLHILSSLEQPTTGSIFYNQAPLNRFSKEQKETFLRKKIGLVFQRPYLIKEMSVLENVMLKGLIEGLDKKECRLHARFLLESVGLQDKIEVYPFQLSGGQAARVALARALFNKPDFLLADEPMGNLDKQTGMELTELLLKLQSDWKMGLIISTHDPMVNAQMETHYVLHNGLLREE